MRQTLIEMGWPQPPTPIQTDNTTAKGVVNNKNFTKNWNLRTRDCTCYAVGKHKNNFNSTETKDPTTGVTITQSNTHQYITRQSAPFLQGALTYYSISSEHKAEDHSKLYIIIWGYL